MSNNLSKRIEITCYKCSSLYEVSVPPDIVSWEYIREYSDNYNFNPACPMCGKRTKIRLIKGKVGDDTRVY